MRSLEYNLFNTSRGWYSFSSFESQDRGRDGNAAMSSYAMFHPTARRDNEVRSIEMSARTEPSVLRTTYKDLESLTRGKRGETCKIYNIAKRTTSRTD